MDKTCLKDGDVLKLIKAGNDMCVQLHSIANVMLAALSSSFSGEVSVVSQQHVDNVVGKVSASIYRWKMLLDHIGIIEAGNDVNC